MYGRVVRYSNIRLPLLRILRSAFLSGKYCRPLPMWRILPSAFLSGVYCRAPNHYGIHCCLSTSMAYIAICLPLRGRRMAIYARDVDRLQCMAEWLGTAIYAYLSCVFCGQPSSLANIAVHFLCGVYCRPPSYLVYIAVHLTTMAYIAVCLPLWHILLSAYL